MKRSLSAAALWKNVKSYPCAAGHASDGVSPELPSLPNEKKRAIPPTHSRWETDKRKVSFDLPVACWLISGVYLHVRGQHESGRFWWMLRLPERFPCQSNPGVVGADWFVEHRKRRLLCRNVACSIIYLCLNSACGMRSWKKEIHLSSQRQTTELGFFSIQIFFLFL